MNFSEQFAEDVKKGLSQTPKRLSSKYFYDEKGSLLFQQIMDLEEYYLTAAEKNIFLQKGDELAAHIRESMPASFQIIELGAGDGRKTELLLNYIDKLDLECNYRPADIDKTVLENLENRLRGKFENISIEKYHAIHETVLEGLEQDDTPTLLLFLGSNIGNYRNDVRNTFIQNLSRALKSGDRFLMGVDRKKNPRKIIAAYDDSKGVTEKFNLNLLHRINRELNANFPVDDFIFYPTYNVELGEVRSYLIASRDMTVDINALDMQVDFKAWEYLHTEISRKYDRQELEAFAKKGDLTIEQLWTDDNSDFWVILFRKD